jgi:hypothetical protein
MILRAIVPATAIVFAGLMTAPSHAATMKECAAQWQDAKKNNATGGKSYRDFSKDCMAGGASDAKATDEKPATGTSASTESKTAGEKSAEKSTSKMSPGRQAMVERERACGAEWKADKAAGKIEKDMTWPKYWSACNARKKGSGT